MIDEPSTTELSNTVRCAIYTRVSTDQGLEQDFNSLDAQREACVVTFVARLMRAGFSPPAGTTTGATWGRVSTVLPCKPFLSPSGNAGSTSSSSTRSTASLVR